MGNTTKRQTVFLALTAWRTIAYDRRAPPIRPTCEAVEWGRSESLDPDNVGDIADEGLFHRG